MTQKVDIRSGQAETTVEDPAALSSVSEIVVLEQRNENGSLLSRTQLKGGLPDGDMTCFGAAQRPVMQATYRRGTLHGCSRLWDEQGQLVQEAYYQNGLQHGLTRVFMAGRLLSEQTFSKGVLHGPMISYADAGFPSCKMEYLHGDIDGEALFFHEGALVRRANYRRGLLEGITIDYDRDEAKIQSAEYKGNLLDGWLRRFWPNGQVMEELLYRQGKPAGKPRRFDRKGAEKDDVDAQLSLMQRLEKLVRG
ncbi:MAG: toxin-antitoxin system YwqK family antitoxin [Ramlibacter sp.]|nr:toxin-antitoxin system YwqK family antitoxin [Ramlibacter sp.]